MWAVIGKLQHESLIKSVQPDYEVQITHTYMSCFGRFFVVWSQKQLPKPIYFTQFESSVLFGERK